MPSEYAMAFDEFAKEMGLRMAKSLQDILGDIPPRQKTFKLEDSWKDLVEALERRMQRQYEDRFVQNLKHSTPFYDSTIKPSETGPQSPMGKAFLEAYGKNLP